MDFEVWERYYMEILREFGFDRKEDERAAGILSELLKGKNLTNDDALQGLMTDKIVAVAGGAGHLERALREEPSWEVLIAADGTTTTLMRNEIVPDIIVTDLDGTMEDQLEANRRGAIVAVHAHGDNIPKIEKYVPRLTGRIVATVQCRPFGSLNNFGGFTDGDRAAIMAAHFNARGIRLLGFDFDVVGDKPGSDRNVKKGKLRWARRLIDSIEIPVEHG